MKRWFSFVLILLLLLMVVAEPAVAAKPRVRSAAPAPAATKKSGGTAYSSAKLSRPTNSIKVTFLNLNLVSRIDYVLAYTANGVPQGAVGAITPSGATTDSRDLYFGTCSHGVCTAHKNITGATLTVTTKLKSGGTHTKRYRIKI